MGKFHDLTGQKFNRLTVIKFIESKGGHSWFLCLCDCGKEKPIRSQDIKSGRIKSCGCYHDESARKSNWKHGKTRTTEHVIWRGIRQRCLDPNNPVYPYYGGRGIKVCQRWQESFSNFYEDMGTRPSKNHSIERLDNNGNYEPENCFWATRSQQANNRRSNHLITYKEKTQNLMQWSEETGVPYKTLWYRIAVAKMPLEKAFNPDR